MQLLQTKSILQGGGITVSVTTVTVCAGVGTFMEAGDDFAVDYFGSVPLLSLRSKSPLVYDRSVSELLFSAKNLLARGNFIYPMM